MNDTNPAYFLLQRYLENISSSRTSMNSLFYSMLNSITEQERNMTELIYHYISSTQMQNSNIVLDTAYQQTAHQPTTNPPTENLNRQTENPLPPPFTNASTLFRNRFTNPIRQTATQRNTNQNSNRRMNTTRQPSLYNRTRNRPRDNLTNTFRPRTNTSDNVWSAILNFANQPNLTSELLRPVVV